MAIWFLLYASMGTLLIPHSALTTAFRYCPAVLTLTLLLSLTPLLIGHISIPRFLSVAGCEDAKSAALATPGRGAASPPNAGGAIASYRSTVCLNTTQVVKGMIALSKSALHLLAGGPVTTKKIGMRRPRMGFSPLVLVSPVAFLR